MTLPVTHHLAASSKITIIELCAEECGRLKDIYAPVQGTGHGLRFAMQVCQHRQIPVAESDKRASKSAVLWGEISNAVMRHRNAVMSELWSGNIITTVSCIRSTERGGRICITDGLKAAVLN